MLQTFTSAAARCEANSSQIQEPIGTSFSLHLSTLSQKEHLLCGAKTENQIHRTKRWTFHLPVLGKKKNLKRKSVKRKLSRLDAPFVTPRTRTFNEVSDEVCRFFRRNRGKLDKVLDRG